MQLLIFWKIVIFCPGSWTRQISMKSFIPSAIFLISIVSVFTLVFQVLVLLQRNNRKYSTLVTTLSLSYSSLFVVYDVLSKHFVYMYVCMSNCPPVSYSHSRLLFKNQWATSNKLNKEHIHVQDNSIVHIKSSCHFWSNNVR